MNDTFLEYAKQLEETIEERTADDISRKYYYHLCHAKQCTHQREYTRFHTPVSFPVRTAFKKKGVCVETVMLTSFRITVFLDKRLHFTTNIKALEHVNAIVKGLERRTRIPVNTTIHH